MVARDSSSCRAGTGGFHVSEKQIEVFAVPRGKRTKRARNNVEDGAEASTVGGEMPVDPALDLLHKRMASELEALRELVKKAELISRGPACKGGAAPAGRRKRILATEPRPQPRVEAGGKMQSVKRRKMSPPLHQNQKQRQIEVPRMSPDEREQLAGRLASLAAVPGHIVEFLQQQFGGGADPEGEIEIDVLKVEDSVLFELKTRLDKFAEESLIADAGFLPKEEHGSVTMEVIRSDAIPEQDEEDVDICGASDSDSDDGAGSTAPPALLPEVVSPAQPPSHPASEVARIAEQTKVRGVQRAAPRAVCLAGAIYRAKVRRELMEMERAVQPNESIHPEVLQRLCIAEYGRPGIMRQLGLFLKADA